MAHGPKPLDVFLVVAATSPIWGCTAFGLWFAPGWANGWPIDRKIVWPAGMACFAFTTSLVLAAIIWATCRAPEEAPPTGLPSLNWVLVSVGVSVAVAVGKFGAFRAQALAVWP
jgi:hypothetical protein